MIIIGNSHLFDYIRLDIVFSYFFKLHICLYIQPHPLDEKMIILVESPLDNYMVILFHLSSFFEFFSKEFSSKHRSSTVSDVHTVSIIDELESFLINI